MQIVIIRTAMTTSSGWCSAFYHLGGATGSPSCCQPRCLRLQLCTQNTMHTMHTEQGYALCTTYKARGSNYAPRCTTMLKVATMHTEHNCTRGSLPLALVARRLPNSLPVRWGHFRASCLKWKVGFYQFKTIALYSILIIDIDRPSSGNVPHAETKFQRAI